jgi:hypothetical protein
MTDKTVNYTDEQTADLVNRYKAGETVEALAEAMGKSVRSVVAKLSREKVYVAKTKAAGTGRVTKAQLINEISDECGVDNEVLMSLEKASVEALQIVRNKLCK